MNETVTVIGGGLAGSEAAWQIAERGVDVRLFEMRPLKQTGAHRTGDLAELVCSNSLGSKLTDRASGVLMSELRIMSSLLLQCAEQEAVPAGGALAVDRDSFGRRVTDHITQHPRIELIRQEVVKMPEDIALISSGPLTSKRFSDELAHFTGEDHLYFFDALSPIVEADSIDLSVAFRASRYGRGEKEDGDYINCPFMKDEYEEFIDALLNAERIPLREYESAIRGGVRAGLHRYFEACLPVEVIAERGREALAYGPMRPVGLDNPHTGTRPYAVVQLRQDNLIGTLYNIVGFQTNLNYKSQARVFRMIPGLKNARFVRYGQMHRNTFINSPKLLFPSLQSRNRENLFFAGQITGVEGYLGNIATGLLAGLNAARLRLGEDLLVLPETTILGALCSYISSSVLKRFQPMKANFGLLPPFDDGLRRNRRQRARAYAERSARDLTDYLINFSD
ncbi:MAG TPA: methylenetetrahydrofolate--tRNA-(uracil(54)-C(5))-methyltransferase (FADH(2)-oxidizing) TrmFO [Anaerolineae bacterium]|nr:methylenetetrahydrofolate--tRNA-(uracil(54)-C(5))-methyltransferase (FADH(2)-oxidizing) TrmFO [Anaerolineae bacterium]